MSGSVNKVILIGRLGKAPEIRTMQSGGRVANLSVATSESWKDKGTGERKESVQWHNVVIFNDALVGIAEKYLDKGSNVYLEGQLETRSWEQDGKKNYTTEVVLRPYRGELTLLDSRSSTEEQGVSTAESSNLAVSATPFDDDIDSEIPF